MIFTMYIVASLFCHGKSSALVLIVSRVESMFLQSWHLNECRWLQTVENSGSLVLRAYCMQWSSTILSLLACKIKFRFRWFLQVPGLKTLIFLLNLILYIIKRNVNLLYSQFTKRAVLLHWIYTHTYISIIYTSVCIQVYLFWI